MKKKGKKEARTGEGNEGNAELRDNRRMRQWVRGSALKHRGPRLSLFLFRFSLQQSCLVARDQNRSRFYISLVS